MRWGGRRFKDGQCVKEDENTSTQSLTVKALDPFSPFISLAPNIKHAVEERNTGSHSDTTTRSLLPSGGQTPHVSAGTGLRMSGTYCSVVDWSRDLDTPLWF